MSMGSRMRSFVWALLQHRRLEDDMAAEMRHHLELRAAALRSEGLTRTEAMRRARLEFGDPLRWREQGREARGLGWIQGLGTDVRVALRSFRRSPGFAAASILTLAIGIGGTTAIFSLVNDVLLRPLPYPDPDRLVRIWESHPSDGRTHAPASPGTFVDWRARSSRFDALGLFDTENYVVSTPAGSLQAQYSLVTPDLFDVLGVSPQMGRTIGDPSAREILISHAFWMRAFGGERNVLGRTVRVEARSTETIVGVMPPGFGFPSATDIWTLEDVSRVGLTRRGSRFYGIVGRMKPGVTPEIARADLAAVSRQLAVEYPSTNDGWSVTLEPLADSMIGSARLSLVALLGAVALVLLIGCANIVNLMLARTTERRRELAIRAALGAGRGRLVRQLLIEAFVLSGAGAIAGALTAAAALPVLSRFSRQGLPRPVVPALSLTALAVCASLSVLVTLAVGALPAISAAGAGPQGAIETGPDRATARSTHAVWHPILIAAEIALSFALASGAVLLVQTFVHLRQVDLGFDPTHVITFDLRMPLGRFDEPSGRATLRSWYQMANSGREMVERVAALPGVESAASSNDVPLAGRLLRTDLTPRPGPAAGDGEKRSVLFLRVSPAYFRTIGTRILAGRDFVEADAASEPQLTSPQAQGRDGAAIVNETAARLLWPDERPLEQFLSTSFDRRTTPRRRVVGVVADTRRESPGTPPEPEVYIPYAEDPAFAMTLLVRTTLPPDRIVPSILTTLADLDPALSTAAAVRLEDVVAASIALPRLSAQITGLFALVALLLSAVGVYGVLAYAVVCRRREVGIRLALGATAQHIGTLFLTSVGRAVVAGLVLGGVLTYVGTHSLSSLLFGVGPTDPMSFVVGAAVLAAASLAASYVPLRRALAVDPAVTLRE